MKKNQKGFGAIEGLLILVIVGLVGGIGWYVWDSNNKAKDSLNNADKSSNVTTKTAVKKEPPKTDETANWKNYSRYEITFKYPADWTFKADDNSQSSATTLTSPDFSSSTESPKGVMITVDEDQFAESGLTADNFKSKHLDPNPNKYSDYKLLTVNGKKAVQFYRGDSRTTVFFLANNKTVTFVLDTFPDRAASSSVYDQVIQTVTY